MCFNCNEVDHIIFRFLEKRENRSGDKYRTRRDEDNKDYKDKGKKSYYIVEEETGDGSNDHDDEVVYVAIKDESNEDEASIVVSYVNNSDKQIVDLVGVHIT